MYCPRCRENYPDLHGSCPECGEALVPYARVTLTLGEAEARAGSKQTVSFPGMFSPAKISLIPGLKDGQMLSVKNARFAADEGYDTGVLEIKLKVQAPPPPEGSTEEAPPKKEPPVNREPPKKKHKKSKPGGGFWAHAAACLSVLPVTVLMTLVLFYFTARDVFEAAGRDELLVLGAMSLALLLLIRLTVRKETDTARRNSLILCVSLVLAVSVRFVPPLLGVDLSSAAGKLRSSAYEACGIEPTTPAPELPAVSEVPYTPVPGTTPAPAPATAEPPSGQSSVIPHFEHRYFLNRLSPEELENFTALYLSIASFSKTCTFPHELSRDSVDLLTTLILTECPELMQVDFTAGYYTLSLFNDKIRSMDIPYAMTRQEYQVKYAACSTLISSAAETMRGMSLYEKEEYVYRLIVNSCAYSVVAPDASNAYGALIGGCAKCDGISLAAKWLFEEAGVTAVVLTGQEPGSSVGHAWNAVLIDGLFCHLDITNDAENDGEYLYPAFNVPEHFMTDIYPYDPVFAARFPLPSVQGYEHCLHSRNGCFVATGMNAHSMLMKKGKALYKQNGGSFTLQFESETDYRAFLNGLDKALSALYYDTLHTAGKYAYNMLDNFRVVRITLSFS